MRRRPYRSISSRDAALGSPLSTTDEVATRRARLASREDLRRDLSGDFGLRTLARIVHQVVAIIGVASW
jgi:hypothetical protein